MPTLHRGRCLVVCLLVVTSAAGCGSDGSSSGAKTGKAAPPRQLQGPVGEGKAEAGTARPEGRFEPSPKETPLREGRQKDSTTRSAPEVNSPEPTVTNRVPNPSQPTPGVPSTRGAPQPDPDSPSYDGGAKTDDAVQPPDSSGSPNPAVE